MNNNITQELNEAISALETVHSAAELASVETKYLGRDKGFNELRREIRSLVAEDRSAYGARINRAVLDLTMRIAEKRGMLGTAKAV